MNGSALDRLCELAGIAAGHTDIWGKQHRPSDATRVALLRAGDALAQFPVAILTRGDAPQV